MSTSVLRASPSISSAIMRRGFRWELASSKAGMIDWMLEIFFSHKSKNASWNSHLAPGEEDKQDIKKKK